MKKEQKPLAPCLKCDKLIVRNTYKRVCDQCRQLFIRANIWQESKDNAFSNGNGKIGSRNYN